MPNLKVFLLGAPHLELDGRPVEIDRQKALALLAYLAVEGGSHTREALATMFWPDYDASRAYAYLRRTLWALKDALGEGWLHADREMVEVRRAANFWLDVEQFRLCLKKCVEHGHLPSETCPECVPLLSQAADLYRADFLSGFSLRDSQAFDDWQFFQAESLRGELANALQRLVGAFTASGEHEEAVVNARRWLALDPLNEEAQRALMLAYANSGQRNAAMRQYQESQSILDAELGVAPQPETTALYEQIRQGRIIPVKDATARAPLEIVRPVHNLPASVTPFVGRKAELAEIFRLLQEPGCSLLTVLGPGGMGKTRLATQAAYQIVESSAPGDLHEVCFVPLASLASPESLVSAIASAANLVFRSEETPRRIPETQKAQLIDYLRDKPLLLLMDNFEHLVAGAGLLSEILNGARGLKILVTSRERLNLPEEWSFELQGMAYPQDGGGAALETYSALQLFVQCARRARADFSMSEAAQECVARICRLVEGNPLAIELAAAWVRLLSCDEIANEVEHSLDFLATSRRGVPERHSSLRAVFEHSWNLLSPAEQRAFRRLSVFRGLFRRAAAEAVLSSADPEATPAFYITGTDLPVSPLAVLSSLVDKSMLHRAEEIGGQTRYQMHELLKQYAVEKLRLDPLEEEWARDRHCFYYAAFLERQMHVLQSHKQIEIMAQIDAELEDVRVAWSWAIQRGHLAAIRQSADALYWFYFARNRYQDAEEDFLKAVQGVRSLVKQEGEHGESWPELQAALAFVLVLYSLTLSNQGDYLRSEPFYQEGLGLAPRLSERDRAYLYLCLSFGIGRLPAERINLLYQESLAYFSQVGDRWSIALAGINYGNFFQYFSTDILRNAPVDIGRARQLYRDSLALFSELGDRFGMILALTNLASLEYSQGDYDEVKIVANEILELSQQFGDRWRSSSALLYLGQAATSLGEYGQAKSHYQESLEIVRRLGNRRITSRHLACLGYVHYLVEEYEPAEKCFQEALTFSTQVDDRREMGMENMNLGSIAQAKGQPEEAQKYYQRAIALLEGTGADWEISISIKRLANLNYELGQTSQAWVNYRRALEISRRTSRIPEMLDNLVGIARLMILEGQAESALELLALALAQPELTRDVREKAQRIRDKLRAELPVRSAEMAISRGQQMSIEQAVAAVLRGRNSE